MELPIAVSVGGLPAPVYGTLVNLSEEGCRLRSLILLDRNRMVEFTLIRPGWKPLALRGRVLSRATPPVGGGFEYGVAFEGLPKSDREQLAREIAEFQRRAAIARNADLPTPATPKNSQRRRAVRTMAAFPVRYRSDDHAARAATANDVSAGGMRLMCNDTLAIGTMITFEFTLPSSVLDVYPEGGEQVEISPFGHRQRRLPDHRRPFEPMVIRGRVRSRFPQARGKDVYGIEFVDIDGYQREEIARFAHAVQLSKIRNP
jgi:hypothetical protein